MTGRCPILATSRRTHLPGIPVRTSIFFMKKQLTTLLLDVIGYPELGKTGHNFSYVDRKR